MQVTVERLSPVVMEFTVEVPAARVKSEVDRAYSTLQRTAHIKGYRPGKAPRQILQHLFSGRVHADVAQRLVDETLNQALAEKSVQPLSKPAIAPSELGPEVAFNYKARFEVRPEVEKVVWEGLELTRPKLDVDDAKVDAELERLRLQHSTLEEPKDGRGAKAADVVTVSFTLEIDGKTQGEGEQTLDIEVGKPDTLKELDAALVGIKSGEQKDVAVTFPANHPSNELRGKAAVFKLTAKAVKERVLPALDDEFAKDCDAESLDALKKKIREDLEKSAKQRQGEAVAERIVAELCKANPIPVPPSLVDQQAQVTERELTMNARRFGQRFEQNADFRARVRADAEVKVRAGLLMAEIARLKEVKVDESDLERGYTELAEQTGKNVAKLKAEYRDPRKREMLVAMILEDKILDLIEKAAKVTDEA